MQQLQQLDVNCVLYAGVYDALRQKYLKCLLFGISEDEAGNCLMEVCFSCMALLLKPLHRLQVLGCVPVACTSGVLRRHACSCAQMNIHVMLRATQTDRSGDAGICVQVQL